MEFTGARAPQPEKRFDNSRNLTLIEHVLIGGSTDYKGGLFTSETFLDMMTNNGRIEKDMLSPLGITEDPNSLKEIKKAREQKGYLLGVITLLGIQEQIDLSNEGLVTSMELSQVDDDGLIAPSWRISLFNVKENLPDANKDNLNRLFLEGKLVEFFDLGFKEGTDELYLSLKPNFKPKDDI